MPKDKLTLTEKEQTWMLENVAPLLQNIIETCEEGESSGYTGVTPADARRLLTKILRLEHNEYAKQNFNHLYGIDEGDLDAKH